MRTKHLLLFFAVLVTGGFTAMKTATSDWDQAATVKKTVETSGETRVMDVAKGAEFNTSDLQAVRLQLKTALNDPAQNGQGLLENDKLEWNFLGPNNVAGRIRAIVIDQENPNVMYAGGASGGIYKTETKGQYWFPIATDYNAGVVGVTSMIQASDNTIYAATGESFTGFNIGTQDAKSFAGVGVFKLAPGGTEFEHLESTDPINNEDFFGIIELAVDPNNSSNLYMTTWKGVYKSVDAGATWSIVEGLPTGYATGVEVSSNGTVIVAVAENVYVNNGSGFVQVSGTEDKMIDTGGVRFKFAVAPSQPDYIYAIGADSLGALLGVYRSIEKGVPGTWETIGLGGSDNFAIFKRVFTERENEIEETQGVLSMAITVNAQDPDYVYIGGMDFWTGYHIPNIEPFQWLQKTYNTHAKYLNTFLGSNIHEIVEHPDNGNLYIATDYGLFRYNNQTLSVKMNAYLNTTQAYSIAFNPKGLIALGAEDNGVFYNDFSGNESQVFFGREVIRQDDFFAGITHGFQTLISQVSPSLLFYQHRNAQLFKSFGMDGDVSIEPYAEDEVIRTEYVSWGTRNSQMAMWESCDYPYGYDSYEYKTYKDLNPGDIDTVESFNIQGAPIIRTIEEGEFYEADSLVPFEDPYKQILAYAAGGKVWLSRTAGSSQTGVGEFEEMENGDGDLFIVYTKYNWIDVFSIYHYNNPPTYLATNVTKGFKADVNSLTFSADGHHLYFAMYDYDNDKSQIFRLDSLHTVLNNKNYSWTYIQKHSLSSNGLLSRIQLLGEIPGREVSSLIIDSKIKGNLIATVAEYDADDKVYFCPVANTSTSSEFSENFRPIQGNLPKVPVFTGVVDVTKSKKLIVGTEVGVWSTNNYSALNPTWVFNSEGVGAIPVTQIRQQQASMDDFSEVENFGFIYMATYGGGVYFDSTSYVARAKDEVEPTEDDKPLASMDVNVYPNPVKTKLNIGISMVQEGEVSVNIYNMAGQVIFTENIGTFVEGKNSYSLDVSDINRGVYFVKISSGGQNDIVKFVKQ